MTITTKSAPPVLWCIHIIGPDEVYAAPDFDTAWAWAEHLNSVHKPRADALDVLCVAVPAVWPHDHASHVADLRVPLFDLQGARRDAERAGAGVSVEEIERVLREKLYPNEHYYRGGELIREVKGIPEAARAIAAMLPGGAGWQAGAEAMREACARVADAGIDDFIDHRHETLQFASRDDLRDYLAGAVLDRIRTLPLPAPPAAEAPAHDPR